MGHRCYWTVPTVMHYCLLSKLNHVSLAQFSYVAVCTPLVTCCIESCSTAGAAALLTGGLDARLLSGFRERFASDAKNQLAQNVCVKHDLLDVLRVSHIELSQHVYNHKVW